MPLKLDWKTHLFSRSCVDLSSTRSGDNDSEIVVTVGFRGSQLALGQDLTDTTKSSSRRQGRKSRSRSRERSSNGRRSAPPDDEVEVQKPRVKPDVVHWKTKVGGGACSP